MKILFLTRKYPPIIGGMENYSYNLISNYKKINPETYFIANIKGNKNLPFFLASSYLQAKKLIKKHKITHLHLCDGLLSPLGNRLKSKTGVKTSITVNGLDITFPNKLYQKYIPKQLSKIDKIVCISNQTKLECIKRGVPSEKIYVVPCGTNPDEFYINKPKQQLRKELEDNLNLDLKNKKILFTTGRLIERKGVEWFVSNVMPKLNKEYTYLISGDGQKREDIRKSIEKNNLQKRVFLLGNTDFDTLRLLYNSSYMFIMPNIKIKGDMEGFGLVAIESASCGVPVIASGIEGIQDAVINGKTGWLIKEKDINGFIERINSKPLSRSIVRKTVFSNYGWKKIVEKYDEIIRK